MADYDFKYQLDPAPEARTDGSGQVAHNIKVISREQGMADPWTVVPAHHKTILVPADEMLVMLAMSNGAAKIAAYKDLLVTHLHDMPNTVNSDWSQAAMEAFMDANDLSAEAAAGADDYITVDLGLTYPVPFSL